MWSYVNWIEELSSLELFRGCGSFKVNKFIKIENV